MSTGINIAPSSDLTVGTTAVTSGTDGRVFFQAGGVVQQDGAFNWDNTNKRLGIGTTPSASRLSVLSTNNTDADMQIRIGSTDTATRFYTIGRESANGQLAFRWGGEAGALGAQFYFPVTTFNTITSSSTDQGTARLRVGNTGVGGRTFAFIAGVHNSSQSNFSLYDETAGITRFIIDGSGNLALGTGTTTPGARLDVRAQGALSTDIAFRVRNSADTANTLSVQGDGQVVFLTNTTNTITIGGTGSRPTIFGTSIQIGVSTGGNRLSFASGEGFIGTFSHSGGTHTFRNNFNDDRGTTLILGDQNSALYFHAKNGQNLYLSTSPNTVAKTWQKSFWIQNGVAPDESLVDHFSMYSTDITAGNAAPHFRTENGAIVKVYQETTGVGASTLVTGVGTPLTDTDTFDGYTLKQIVKALRNQGLLA
jgi:hypothetical protein